VPNYQNCVQAGYNIDWLLLLSIHFDLYPKVQCPLGAGKVQALRNYRMDFEDEHS
jgi:hypothetical protein